MEYINSSHWWLGVITDSQFKQFKDAVTGVKTRSAEQNIHSKNPCLFIQQKNAVSHRATVDIIYTGREGLRAPYSETTAEIYLSDVGCDDLLLLAPLCGDSYRQTVQG